MRVGGKWDYDSFLYKDDRKWKWVFGLFRGLCVVVFLGYFIEGIRVELFKWLYIIFRVLVGKVGFSVLKINLCLTVNFCKRNFFDFDSVLVFFCKREISVFFSIEYFYFVFNISMK